MKSFSIGDSIIGFILGFSSYMFHDKMSPVNNQQPISIEENDSMLVQYESTLKDLDVAMDSANYFSEIKVGETIDVKNRLSNQNRSLDAENDILATAVNDAYRIMYDSFTNSDTIYIHKN
jgi:hypothetical protein